jgi:hypothetical protein
MATLILVSDDAVVVQTGLDYDQAVEAGEAWQDANGDDPRWQVIPGDSVSVNGVLFEER